MTMMTVVYVILIFSFWLYCGIESNNKRELENYILYIPSVIFIVSAFSIATYVYSIFLLDRIHFRAKYFVCQNVSNRFGEKTARGANNRETMLNGSVIMWKSKVSKIYVSADN